MSKPRATCAKPGTCMSLPFATFFALALNHDTVHLHQRLEINRGVIMQMGKKDLGGHLWRHDAPVAARCNRVCMSKEINYYFATLSWNFLADFDMSFDRYKYLPYHERYKQ